MILVTSITVFPVCLEAPASLLRAILIVPAMVVPVIVVPVVVMPVIVMPVVVMPVVVIPCGCHAGDCHTRGCHAGGCHAGGCHAGGCHAGGCHAGGCHCHTRGCHTRGRCTRGCRSSDPLVVCSCRHLPDAFDWTIRLPARLEDAGSRASSSRLVSSSRRRSRFSIRSFMEPPVLRAQDTLLDLGKTGAFLRILHAPLKCRLLWSHRFPKCTLSPDRFRPMHSEWHRRGIRDGTLRVGGHAVAQSRSVPQPVPPSRGKGRAVHKLIHAAVKGREEKAFQAVSFSVRISITGAVSALVPQKGLLQSKCREVPEGTTRYNRDQHRSLRTRIHTNCMKRHPLQNTGRIRKHTGYSHTR